MQNGELARSTQRLIEMLRPEKVGTAAQTAMTWFKPLPISSTVVKPIRFPELPPPPAAACDRCRPQGCLPRSMACA